jgi:hypothetical protein
LSRACGWQLHTRPSSLLPRSPARTSWIAGTRPGHLAQPRRSAGCGQAHGSASRRSSRMMACAALMTAPVSRPASCAPATRAYPAALPPPPVSGRARQTGARRQTRPDDCMAWSARASRHAAGKRSWEEPAAPLAGAGTKRLPPGRADVCPAGRTAGPRDGRTTPNGWPLPAWTELPGRVWARGPPAGAAATAGPSTVTPKTARAPRFGHWRARAGDHRAACGIRALWQGPIPRGPGLATVPDATGPGGHGSPVGGGVPGRPRGGLGGPGLAGLRTASCRSASGDENRDRAEQRSRPS